MLGTLFPRLQRSLARSLADRGRVSERANGLLSSHGGGDDIDDDDGRRFRQLTRHWSRHSRSHYKQLLAAHPRLGRVAAEAAHAAVAPSLSSAILVHVPRPLGGEGSGESGALAACALSCKRLPS